MRALGIKNRGSQARVLAGAIASAELVEKNGSDQDKPKAKELRAIVIAAGTPPWKDAKKAMAANDAKVQLDMLSIPGNERGMKQLDPGKKGIHQAFWIDRKDVDGEDRHSCLCKPATEPDPEDDLPAPSGGKPGGEGMREALAGLRRATARGADRHRHRHAGIARRQARRRDDAGWRAGQDADLLGAGGATGQG